MSQTILFHVHDHAEASYTLEQLTNKLKNTMRERKSYPTRIAFHHNYTLEIYDIATNTTMMTIDAQDMQLEIARELPDGNIAAGSYIGLILFDLHSKTSQNFSRPMTSVYTTLGLHNGDILCETGRVELYHANDHTFTTLLESGTRCSFLRLKNGDILISTHDVYLYRESTNGLTYVKTLIKDAKIVDALSYYSLLEVTPGVTLAFSDGIIHKIDIKTGTISIAMKTKQSKGRAYYGILLVSGNIAIAYANKDIDILDRHGKLVRCLKQVTTGYVGVIIGQVAPYVIAALDEEHNLNFWCEITGRLLKRVHMQGRDLLCFLK
jgi:hypothetical protein